jgi:glycosyltransferase involved in cell wall biosynthesis
MTRRLRVHVVVQTGMPGGAERVLVDLLRPAADRLELSFVALADGPLLGELRALGPVSVVPTARGRAAVVRSALRLARAWRRLEADLVLANGIKSAAVAVPAARIVGIRVAWFKHDFAHDETLAPLLARMADAVVATSEEVAAAAGGRVAVVPPGRPLAPLPRADARARLEAYGLPHTDALVVATVGRLVSYKGVDDVVAALALPEAEGWHLAVVGAPDPAEAGELERLRRFAAERGVGERVTFLGSVPDAGRLLTGVDAVAVTTKTDARGYGREGFGLVADEAMVAGVPVIATPGPPAARADGAAVVVAPAAPAEVSAALSRLADGELRRALGRRGSELAAARADTEARSAELVAVLAAAAARPGAALEAAAAASVVTTVLDEGPAVDELIERLLPQLREADEVVVVDGGSEDDTVERVLGWMREDGRVRLVEAPGTTPAAGRNAGVRNARHDIVVCTDAGCTPWPGWLDALRSPFAERLPPDLVTGVYEVAAGRTTEHAVAAACYPSLAEARRPGPLRRAYGALFGTAFVADLPTGRSLAFTRRAWARVGGFRETLVTAEDVSFGRDVAARGRCVLAVDAVVTWRQRRTLRETALMYARYGRGSVRSADRRLIGRDAARAVAYPVGAAVAWRGGRRARRLLGVGVAAYTSVPLLRATTRPRPLLVALLVPAALALKDVSKAAGMLAEAADRARAARRRT